MHHVIGMLLIGAVAGGVAADGKKRRPLARRIVRTGILAKRKLEAAGAAAVAETRKLVDEARADLDHPESEMDL